LRGFNSINPTTNTIQAKHNNNNNNNNNTSTNTNINCTYSIMTEEASSTTDEHDKRTLGEELYLVHLSRFNKLERSETDYDHEAKEPRKRSLSAGEELWQVHLKRSAGLDLEADEDKEPSTIGTKKKLKVETPVTKKSPTPIAKKGPTRVIHLRNRNVKIPKAAVKIPITRNVKIPIARNVPTAAAKIPIA
jgi:hypothetical protein